MSTIAFLAAAECTPETPVDNLTPAQILELCSSEGHETFALGLPLGEIIIAIVAFAVLFFVLRKFAWPQFEKAYDARTKAIEGGIAEAAQAQNEAKAALEEYRAQLAGAREEAAKIREDARAQAQGIRADLLAQATAETERIAAAGRSQLDAQRAQIIAELRSDLGRMSVDLASKVVGESLSEEAAKQRTVERFLADLER